MNATTTRILGLVLLAWLIGGAIWFGKNYASNEKGKAQTVAKFSPMISDGDFSITFPSIYAFEQSSAEIIISEQQITNLQTLANYLNDHPKRMLLLSGVYHTDEINTSNFDNLGKGRAEMLKQNLRRLGVLDQQLMTRGVQREELPLNENDLISGGIEYNFSDLERPTLLQDFPNKYQISASQQDLVFADDLDTYLANLRQYLVDAPKTKMNWVIKSTRSQSANIWVKKLQDVLKEHRIDYKNATHQYLSITKEQIEEAGIEIQTPKE